MRDLARIALLLLALLPRPARAGTVRLAVVIGHNRGALGSRPLRYAERDARKFYEVLVQLGGFDAAGSRLLLGRPADEVWRALRQVEGRVRRLVRNPGARTILVVYYSGHADGNALELGRSELGFGKLRRFLAASRADVRLAFVDSCRSGQLVAAKGGRRAGGYQIQVSDEVASLGYAVITSSSADELSQESAEIRGSFFTHYLVSGLRGAGDLSGDGEVTLGEVYRYAYRRTVARTSATVGGSQHPMYDFQLAGRGDIVLTRIPDRHGALVVSSRSAGRVMVLDRSADSMVAEGQLLAGRPTRLALPPGAYQVYLLEEGAVRRAEVRLPRDGSVTLTDSDFVRQRLGRGLAKGGLFRRRRSHDLGLGLLVRRMPLEGGTVTLGPALGYGLGMGEGWELLARGSWGGAPDVGLSTGYQELALHVGAGYRLPIYTSSIRITALVGYEHLFQGERDGLSRHTSAFAWSAGPELRVPVWGPLWLELGGGVGGRVLRMREGGATHRLDLQGTVGTGFAL